MGEKSVKITMTFNAVIDIEDYESIAEKTKEEVENLVKEINNNSYTELRKIELNSHLLLDYSDQVNHILILGLDPISTTEEIINDILLKLNREKEHLIYREIRKEENELVIKIAFPAGVLIDLEEVENTYDPLIYWIDEETISAL